MIEQAPLEVFLAELLPAHLASQRWAGLHGRSVRSVGIEWLEVVQSEPLLAWAVVEAEIDGDPRQRYQLLIGGRPAHPAPDFLAGKDREVLGTVGGTSGPVVLYDALIDPDLAIAALHLTAPDVDVVVRRPLVLEHSNSSVVFDEAVILKVFRKVGKGPNPDVEITRVLAEGGCDLVLAPLAELARDGTHLAVLRPFVRGATDGWQLARTSVRDVLASRLAPEESGGDFAPNSSRLGRTVAGLHLAMADAWGATAAAPSAWVRAMGSTLDAVADGSAADLPAGALDVAALRAQLDGARDLDDAGVEIRVHGDLHLAQVIRGDAGWLVIDFEGEPARDAAGSTTRSSPLRDVAGMLRSFHYAAASGLAEWDEADDELAEVLAAWEQRNRDAFLAGYLEHPGIAALLPADPAARQRLLTAFELDKAVYELGYELAHRPHLVAIPLEGIARLVRGSVPT